ncbi:hypothetical protein Ddye_002039 [Dipteronia dyeriana]|uniref:PHD and RING finger domain-containing protein 1 n=1 Tax=Dipteronia dyeriana TaxID=168575 RepID=A0AAD9XQ20_9ROSI|nr:hypothetical protein Ddye_002039 [Dipteronia dyeriana]
MAGNSELLDSSSNPNKRLKTLIIPEPDQNQESSKLMEESYSVCCGICLLEEGRSIRGQIDSCSHYFCFVCIIEWSRIESTCPMCKQRFTTIRRPPKDGIFSSERIVNVPKRDQIYNGLGNASIGPFDPYQHVSCSVCHEVTDESLLLLCDLCDGAAHTFCVGLGTTVPEGDWFCHDCTVLRTEHDNNTEIDTGDGNEDIFENLGAEQNNTRINIDGGSQSMMANSESEIYNADIDENSVVIAPTDALVSIFDIVHEELNIGRSRQITFSLKDQLSTSVVSGIGSRRTNRNNAGKPTESGARTLHRCRNVQSRIRTLRENWNKLRKGSLGFSSSGSIESGGESSRGHNISKMFHDGSGQPQSTSSRSFLQLRAQDGSFGEIIQDGYRSPFVVNKAWKMMKIAKSMPQTRGRASSVHEASKLPSVNGYASQQATIKGYASRQATNTGSSINIVKKQQSGKCDIRSIQIEKRCIYYSNESEIQNHKSLMSKLQEQSKVMAVESFEGLRTHPSPRLFESPSSTNIQTQSYASHLTGTRPVAEDVSGASSRVSHEQGGSSCSLKLVRSVPGTSNSCNSKPELNMSSSIKIDTPEIKDMLGKGHVQRKASKDDDAKREIQSLVKLNLKVLSRDKKLEFDKFKEVARLATHTILAACGLEHRESGIRTIPISVVCSHAEDIEQIHKSTLLPGSCRECFYVFVKDVVQSIMLEEVAKGKLNVEEVANGKLI